MTNPSLQTDLTTGDVVRLTGRPDWMVRRVADSLGVRRLGNYRIIPADMVPAIRAELDRRYPRKEVAANA